MKIHVAHNAFDTTDSTWCGLSISPVFGTKAPVISFNEYVRGSHNGRMCRVCTKAIDATADGSAAVETAAQAFHNLPIQRDNDMNVEIVDMTPEMAKELLAGNTNNRSIKRAQINRFSKILREGKWELTPDAVLVLEDGTLGNGQHRLSAIAETGITARIAIMNGGTRATQDATDDGVKRTASDGFAIRGEKYAALLATAARRVRTYEMIGVPYNHAGKGASLGNAQLYEVLERHPSLRDSSYFASSIRSKTSVMPIQPGVVAGLHYIFAYDHPDDASEFFTTFASGANLEVGSPILTLRNRLIAEKTKPGVHLRDRVVVNWVCRSWNAYREGEELRVLQMPKSGFVGIHGCTIKLDKNTEPPPPEPDKDPDDGINI